MGLGLLSAQRICIAESQVNTAQSGRNTPSKGSYSSLYVEITKTCLVAKVVIHCIRLFLLSNIALCSIRRGFWSARA